MTAAEILEIIGALPEYILYIYPGYITIYVYYFLRGKTLRDNRQMLVKSIMISYIYVTLTAWIPIRNAVLANVGYILLSLAVAYVCYRLTLSSGIYVIFNFLKINTTYYESEVEALAGCNNGAWLIVYVKSSKIAIEGSLGFKELEEGKERYITLDAYKKYFVKDDGTLLQPALCDYSDDYEEQCVIKYDDIKRIEKRATLFE